MNIFEFRLPCLNSIYKIAFYHFTDTVDLLCAVYYVLYNNKYKITTSIYEIIIFLMTVFIFIVNKCLKRPQ